MYGGSNPSKSTVLPSISVRGSLQTSIVSISVDSNEERQKRWEGTLLLRVGPDSNIEQGQQ